RVDAERLPVRHRRSEPPLPSGVREALVTPRHHAHRNLRAVAPERLPEPSAALVRDHDDVAGVGRRLEHIGAINPGMSRTDALFATAGEGDGGLGHEAYRSGSGS